MFVPPSFFVSYPVGAGGGHGYEVGVHANLKSRVEVEEIALEVALEVTVAEGW